MSRSTTPHFQHLNINRELLSNNNKLLLRRYIHVLFECSFSPGDATPYLRCYRINIFRATWIVGDLWHLLRNSVNESELEVKCIKNLTQSLPVFNWILQPNFLISVQSFTDNQLRNMLVMDCTCYSILRVRSHILYTSILGYVKKKIYIDIYMYIICIRIKCVCIYCMRVHVYI